MANIVGLDFGTTYSLISILKDNDLEVFSLPYMQYIPSAVAYTNLEGEYYIGKHAIFAALEDPDNVELYQHFKMFLPASNDKELYGLGWHGGKSPVQVTRDFLYKLLIDPNDDFSFVRNKGEIEKIIVTVPEVWQKNPGNIGAIRLKDVLESLGLPLVQLLSEPVAAAAYYTWKKRQKQKNFSDILLVCDAGGGTFDVSLIWATPEKIEVLYHDGSGLKKLGKAGVAYDMEVVKRVCCRKKSSDLFIKAMYEFEQKKINVFTTPYIIKKFLKDLEDEALQNKKLFEFKIQDRSYAISPKDLIESFEPIKKEIWKVLRKIKNYMEKHDVKLDHLIIVGGFGRFILVRKAIEEFFDTKDDLSSSKNNSYDITYQDSHYAISYGAALVAGGKIEVSEKFRHSIGLIVENIPTGKEELVKIIKAGTPINQLRQALFYQDENGQQFVFTVKKKNEVRIDLVTWIDGKNLPESRQIILKTRRNFSTDLKYGIGMRVDESNILWIIFKNEKGEIIQKELGKLFY